MDEMILPATLPTPFAFGGRTARSRIGCAAGLSVGFHLLLGLWVMQLAVRTPLVSAPIRVFLYDPPPPPAASGAGTGPPSVAPVVPAPQVVALPQKPARRPVIRTHKVVEQPAAKSPAAPKAEVVAPDSGDHNAAGNVPGGVASGVVGGVVGGTGHTLLPADQAARLPVAISRVLPEYPAVARLRGIEGQVVLEAIVAADGKVEPDVVIVQSVPLLDTAAVAAVRQWRFQPARDSDGAPIRVSLRVPVRFVLR